MDQTTLYIIERIAQELRDNLMQNQVIGFSQSGVIQANKQRCLSAESTYLEKQLLDTIRPFM